MNRLDVELYKRGLAMSRNRSEMLIKEGLVKVDGVKETRPSRKVEESTKIQIKASYQYVSRAAEKLASVSKSLKINYQDKVVLDVGSSTGGFTQYAINHGAKKVIAVDVGTGQLHPKLHGNPKVELHEKTDIRDFKTDYKIDLVLADVSFISLTYILPHIKTLVNSDTVLCVMCKPQFEAGKHQVNKGVIKNSAIRRKILKDFENWLTSNNFIIKDKADSQVAGIKGNIERFYKLKVV